MFDLTSLRATLLATAATIAISAGASFAQTPPGSGGGVLPRPDPAFKGRIGETYTDSTPDYPAPMASPANAPNVLLILLDDVGFGHTGTFGGAAETRAMDRLAVNGLRYNQFHTTALCSPTRAALLTGRNHHSVGTGVIIEMGTGYPGYTGIVPASAAGLPETLRLNGYATAAFGKWHNTPATEISPAGPFDRWPTGRTWGFDYFYGFMNGETHQYYPVLYRNTTPIDQPKQPEQGYHLTADLVDEAVGWMNQVNATAPDKPWFMYFSTGAIHAPHHTPDVYREKYEGRFEGGWDRYRQETFARQKELKVVPEAAKLTPRPKEIPAWDDQPAVARRVYARLMENYTGFLDHTDDQIGRLIDALERSGELDNTLILFIAGDNGASAEGGLEGTVNEIASLNGIQLGLQSLEAKFDEIGGPSTEPHVPVGWAWAANTPFQWTKQVASHFGGTRNGLIVHWPERIRAGGEIRSQFHHVIDIAPTILEAAGVTQPKVVNGVEQKPIEGVSMMYSLDSAEAPSRRTIQYFEMRGARGIYKDGWMATTRHDLLPWQTAGRTGSFDQDRWELYDVRSDFTQAKDLAGQNAAKVAELKAAFLEEARKYNVLPLDDRMSERLDLSLRPSPISSLSKVVYGPGIAKLGISAVPSTASVPFSVTAEIDIEEDASSAEGALAAMGGISGGWSLYIKGGRPAFAYNYFEVEKYDIAADEDLRAGRSVIRAEVTPTEPGPGKPATVKLFINGVQAGEGRITRTVPFAYGIEGFDVGRDDISPVSSAYQSPFPFTGRIEQVTIEVPKPDGVIGRAIK